MTGSLPIAPPPPAPDPPPGRDRRVPGFLQTVLFFAAYIVLSMVGGAVLALLLLALGLGKVSAGGLFGSISEAQIWANAFLNLAVFAFLLVVGKIWAARPWSEILPLRTCDWRLLPALAVAGLGFAITLSEADNLLRHVMPPPDWLVAVMEELMGHGVATAFLIIVVAPVTEEAFFRGFVLNGFLKRYRPWVAALLSALLFGVFHLNPYQLIGAIVLGVVLAWLRIRTGSLWPCLWLHALNNALSFSAPHLGVEIPGLTTTEGGAFQPWWLDLVGLLLLASGLLLLWRLLGEHGSPGTRSAAGPTDARG